MLLLQPRLLLFPREIASLNANPRYFFCSGAGKPRYALANWQRGLSRVFELAEIKHADGSQKRCYAHMFRHTFANNSLTPSERLAAVAEWQGDNGEGDILREERSGFRPNAPARLGSLTPSERLNILVFLKGMPVEDVARRLGYSGRQRRDPSRRALGISAECSRSPQFAHAFGAPQRRKVSPHNSEPAATMTDSMTRQHILDEMRRTAQGNGGTPLGRDRFERETGIRDADWHGKYWVRWNDAVREAGLSPNVFGKEAYDSTQLIQQLVDLIRELGHFPVRGELRMKKRRDSLFPTESVFVRRFGSRSQLKKAVLEYCRTHEGFDDVRLLCGTAATVVPGQNEGDSGRGALSPAVVGFVYLVKFGKHYKIGKTNALGRREYELAIQFPEKLRTLHSIKTDDPEGIEKYWHQRFASKRGNGEWFNLDGPDVQAFKRRKFM